MTENIPPCFYRLSVKALILDETRTKFLVVQEDNGKWELPGGGLDWGEAPEQGLARELQEEMGITLTTAKPTPAYFIPGFKNMYGRYIANIVFEATVDNLDFTPSEECIALKFVTAEEAKMLDAFDNVHLLAGMFDPTNHRH